MNYIVTGGAGFIGSNLTNRLLQEGHNVAVIDFSSETLENLSLNHPRLKIYNENICNNEEMKKIFNREKPKAVFHMAAQIDVRKSVSNPGYDYQVNVEGSKNLISLAKEHKSKFIFSSSGGAIYDDKILCASEQDFENPKSPYGFNKLNVDKFLQESGIDFVSLRYANVYGPRQNAKGEAGVIAIFFDSMLNNRSPTINGNGLQTRDYVFVEDVVDANVLALRKLPSGIYNIGTGIETNVNELFDTINVNFFNGNFEKRYVPGKKGEQMRSSLNSDKIRNYGWKPKFTLGQGLQKTYEWFMKNQISPFK
ncbi:MAG: NAD-dependent epimerase/dehydratase family protein [Nanoarchaeota archaeon]|nr:NAD-dependent epimerase/dehydratase family protein [Nanoarchaeota archaeon]